MSKIVNKILKSDKAIKILNKLKAAKTKAGPYATKAKKVGIPYVAGVMSRPVAKITAVGAGAAMTAGAIASGAKGVAKENRKAKEEISKNQLRAYLSKQMSKEQKDKLIRKVI